MINCFISEEGGEFSPVGGSFGSGEFSPRGKKMILIMRMAELAKARSAIFYSEIPRFA